MLEVALFFFSFSTEMHEDNLPTVKINVWRLCCLNLFIKKGVMADNVLINFYPTGTENYKPLQPV